MDVNGKWAGYGLGDVSPVVQLMKANFLRRFSYASQLQVSLLRMGTAAQTYDQTMVDVVTEMQKAYLASPATIQGPQLVADGIMNYAWQIRSEFVAPPMITILTAQGTGVDMWDTDSPQPYGAALQVAKNCKNVRVQPVGNYPASIDNPWMGTSVQMGVDSAVALLGGAPPISPGDPVWPTGPIVGWWYSQSAILGSHLWRDETLNPNGRLAHRKNDWIATVTYGNPNRPVGIAHGNDAAGWGPSPIKDGAPTGGISGPDCLTAAQLPPWWYDYVWLGSDNGQTELYTANPDNATGKVGTSIYNVVQDPTLGDVASVAADLLTPLATVQEIYNGITFAVKGPNADHFAYDTGPSIAYVTGVCQTWTANYINSGGAIA